MAVYTTHFAFILGSGGAHTRAIVTSKLAYWYELPNAKVITCPQPGYEAGFYTSVKLDALAPRYDGFATWDETSIAVYNGDVAFGSAPWFIKEQTEWGPFDTRRRGTDYPLYVIVGPYCPTAMRINATFLNEGIWCRRELTVRETATGIWETLGDGAPNRS